MNSRKAASVRRSVRAVERAVAHWARVPWANGGRGVVALLGLAAFAGSASSADVTERIRSDSRAGRPLVAHVVVALCDNVNQGIVPVPRGLGNGQDPGSNLYWGARYGIKSFFRRASGWTMVSHSGGARAGVLERAAFRSSVGTVPVFVVAEAWDGARIREAIATFLEMASGRETEPMVVDGVQLQSGGQAHVVAFVGHNGLMDFPAPTVATGLGGPARAAAVLACASEPYFGALLRRCQAYPLLVTTGLMAPEAYSLEAALRVWFSSGDSTAARAAAAGAYSRHQGCGLRAARRLFAMPQ